MKKLIAILMLSICINVFADEASPAQSAMPSGYYFTAPRAPQATENYISSQVLVVTGYPIESSPGNVKFFNSATNRVYDFAGGANGSLQWVQRGYTPTPLTTNNNVSHTLNSAYQISTTQDANFYYSISAVSGLSLVLTTSSGVVYVDVADNSGFTTNVVTIVEQPISISGVLAFSITNPILLSGHIQAGKYVRIRTTVTAGSITYSYIRGQEVIG